MNKTLSITAADPQHLFLKGIADYLRTLPIVKCVNTYSTYPELMQNLREDTPDMVFLDLNFYSKSGFDVCEEIKRFYPGVYLAILTQYDSEEYVKKARRCGVDAYFMKSTDPEIIACFLNNLMNNTIKGFFSHVPYTSTRSSNISNDNIELKELLTCREREVLALLANGVSRLNIESSLGISYSTFKTHRTNLMKKLKIKNDIELGIFSIRHGLCTA
ncbi:MAG: DNA-binding response regulator [Bacteroidota bacterium]|nr:DNA-binding response regulator [Bacteroidota bacterium]